MPTFSSSINKSGSTRRVAPKAPPRRTIRSASAQNAGSYSDDAASQSLSFPGTPDPQAAVEKANSNPIIQKESSHQEYDSGSDRRNDGHIADQAKSEAASRPSAAIASTATFLHPPKAPVIISTASQLTPPPQSVASEDGSEGPAEVAGTRSSELTLGQSQGRKSSSTSTSRKDTGVGAEAGAKSIVEAQSGPGNSTTKPTRRGKLLRQALNVAADLATNADANHTAASQALEEDVSDDEEDVQPPRKRNARLRPRRSPSNNDEGSAQPRAGEGAGLRPTKPASTRSRLGAKGKPKKTVQEVADEVIAEASGGVNGGRGKGHSRKRKRTIGSEEAENHEIVPAEVKMGDLVKDQGLGKGSKREAEMQKIDWMEVKRKRREAQAEAVEEEKKQRTARKNGRPLPAPGPHAAERLVLVNGQMVIDESSRVIDRNAATARDADQMTEAINEDHLTTRVNQATVGRKPGSARNYSVWDDEETEQFYQGLRMFGTDFMMISKMFPDTSRAVVKKKYTKEEKLHPEKVFAALNSKEPVDLQALSELTKTVYEDPKDFYKELEEEQARLEAEDARVRAEEAEADAEQVIQESVEQGDGAEGTEEEQDGAQSSARKNRFAAEAQSIVDDAASQKKKSKKTLATTKKKTNSEGRKGKRLPAEGTEEIIGSIENFDP